MLLAEQQCPVAIGDRIGGGAAAACVDLPPGLQRGRVDDPGPVQLLDLRHPAGQVGLVHHRLILEDLFLHGQERRLVKAEITGGTPGQPPRCPAERRDHRFAHGVREHSQVPEAGVKSRADHGRQASPLQVGVLDEQPPVVAVDSLDRPPVLPHSPPRAPAPALDTRAVKRPPEPGLPQLACLHAHDATTPAPTRHAVTRGPPGPHPAVGQSRRKPRAPASGPGEQQPPGPGTAARQAPAANPTRRYPCSPSRPLCPRNDAASSRARPRAKAPAATSVPAPEQPGRRGCCPAAALPARWPRCVSVLQATARAAATRGTRRSP